MMSMEIWPSSKLLLTLTKEQLDHQHLIINQEIKLEVQFLKPIYKQLDYKKITVWIVKCSKTHQLLQAKMISNCFTN
jgi:hypothetical protein